MENSEDMSAVNEEPEEKLQIHVEVKAINTSSSSLGPTQWHFRDMRARGAFAKEIIVWRQGP